MGERTIIVTGANRGIGAAIAEDLLRRGYRVMALCRSPSNSIGEYIHCDVADASSIASAVAAASACGNLVGIVNNAGMHAEARSSELTADAFDSMMAVNARSVLIASREVRPHLIQNGGGLIVNIGSLFDKLGIARNAAYCASKAAVGALTRCLAAEWASDGIRVVNVAPGYIVTDLNRSFTESERGRAWLARRVPIGRAGHVDEVARLVGALFSENLSFLSGETIYLDGAQGINQ
ncbi:MAG: SDR family oxidoreductase [Hyphomonadaceae bacterium]|nr:SDR family oxidoreductase [Hyphomonadaceae bacterium]